MYYEVNLFCEICNEHSARRTRESLLEDGWSFFNGNLKEGSVGTVRCPSHPIIQMAWPKARADAENKT